MGHHGSLGTQPCSHIRACYQTEKWVATAWLGLRRRESHAPKWWPLVVCTLGTEICQCFHNGRIYWITNLQGTSVSLAAICQAVPMSLRASRGTTAFFITILTLSVNCPTLHSTSHRKYIYSVGCERPQNVEVANIEFVELQRNIMERRKQESERLDYEREVLSEWGSKWMCVPLDIAGRVKDQGLGHMGSCWSLLP